MSPDLITSKRSAIATETGSDSKRQKVEDVKNVSEGSDLEVIELSRNQRESPLLRLPAEIRSCIYEYVLGGLTVYPLSSKIRWGMNLGWTVDSTVFGHTKSQKWELSMNLLYTCRDIYKEARLLPFKLNVFHIYGPEFRDWTDKLTGGRREAIAAVQIWRSYDIHLLYFGPLIPPVLQQCTGLKKIIRGPKLTLEQHRMVDSLAQQMNLEISDMEEASVDENGAEEGYDSDEEFYDAHGYYRYREEEEEDEDEDEDEDDEDIEDEEEIEDVEDDTDGEEFDW